MRRNANKLEKRGIIASQSVTTLDSLFMTTGSIFNALESGTRSDSELTLHASVCGMTSKAVVMLCNCLLRTRVEIRYTSYQSPRE